MDYRMEHRDGRRFLAMVRAFPNEVVDDDNDKSIPQFWTECYDKNLVEPMKSLCVEGRRDLYGLCGALQGSETHFNYGIGVLPDEQADPGELEQFVKKGYSIWETKPADYVVFKCFGSDGESLGETWSKFFKEFVPQTGYVQTEEADYELYPENGEKDLFCELWIPVSKA